MEEVQPLSHYFKLDIKLTKKPSLLMLAEHPSCCLLHMPLHIVVEIRMSLGVHREMTTKGQQLRKIILVGMLGQTTLYYVQKVITHIHYKYKPKLPE